MNLKDLQTLLDYHYWARDRVLDAAAALSPEQFTRDLGSSFKSVRDTLAHTYVAEWAWYSRWTGHSPKAAPPFETFSDVAALRRAWTELEGGARAFVDGLGEEGLHRVIEYRLLSGQARQSAIWQLVQHVVNHATYHRGQVSTMLRQLGAKPARSMDLDDFYLERSG